MTTRLNRRAFLGTAALATAAPTQAANAAAFPLTSFRIGTAYWLSDKCFEDLLAYFRRFPGVTDELAFFTSETHPPLPLEVMEERAARLAILMPRARQLGIRAGVNVLATMGHHEENLANSLRVSWQRVMDIDGNICAGSFCPAQPELLDYARRVYAAMAKAGPDFIWLDDDIRLAGHGKQRLTCFCDRCLTNFEQECGRRFTRSTLADAFNGGSLDDRLGWRRRWLEHNRDTIDRLLQAIEQAVHAVKPGLELGFMTGDRFWEGYGFARWARTLSGPQQAAVRWRPGGGFYSDERLIDLVDKANALGRQASVLPPEIAVIQSEIENFPYQRLRKAAATTVVESSAYIAAGTTGSAFNVINMRPDPLDEYLPLAQRIAAGRPFHQLLEQTFHRSKTEGLWPAWNDNLQITINPNGDWLGDGRLPLNEPYTLGEIGIPITYDPAGRAATALSRTAPFAFTRDELEKMFRGGVLMDVDAWFAMRQLGLADWTGVRAARGFDADSIEELEAHPINGRFAGWSRDCRQSFWKERAWAVEPAGSQTAVLAHLRDYSGKRMGPCMTAFENALGGRVVIQGYYPWSQFHSLAKSSQLKAVADWISRDGLPALVESYTKLILWHRNRSFVVLNASLDAAERAVIRVKSGAGRWRLRDLDGADRSLMAEGGRLHLPRLAPWSISLLTRA